MTDVVQQDMLNGSVEPVSDNQGPRLHIQEPCPEQARREWLEMRSESSTQEAAVQEDVIPGLEDTQVQPEPELPVRAIDPNAATMPDWISIFLQDLASGWDNRVPALVEERTDYQLRIDTGTVVVGDRTLKYACDKRALYIDFPKIEGSPEPKLILYFDSTAKPSPTPKQQFTKPEVVETPQTSKAREILIASGMDLMLVKFMTRWMSLNIRIIKEFKRPYFTEVVGTVFPLLNTSLLADFDATHNQLKELASATNKGIVIGNKRGPSAFFIDRESMVLATDDVHIGPFVVELNSVARSMPRFTYVVEALLDLLDKKATKTLYTKLLSKDQEN